MEQWRDLINNHVTNPSQSLRDTADRSLRISQKLRERFTGIRRCLENTTLMCSAIEKCEDETVNKWLKLNSKSAAFGKLGPIFNFLKKIINEEEKKDHGDKIDITFLAHGRISESMTPACCLLPLSTVTDVVLYSPWNCTLHADAAYGIATGVMKPQHRVFNCKTTGCPIPKGKHRPEKPPDHWNSMKRAGEQEIPNITLTPLSPPKDGFLNKFESLAKEYGLPERNRIIIPYVIPEEETSQQGDQSVPFYVVSLAFSLALVGSRFKATIHLATCLGDESPGIKCDKEYLKNQYACTVDNTVMTASPDMFKKILF